jgi:hypothetical protein
MLMAPERAAEAAVKAARKEQEELEERGVEAPLLCISTTMVRADI